MKKLLWILLVFLLLGAGFLYIIKTPSSAFSQKVLTTLGITLPASEKNEIEANCISYFDGCNTCIVQSGVIGGCTKMLCETPAKPQCLDYAWTGMDLTNCISYFDGCNNCTVENGKPSACTEMYCEASGEPKCTQYAKETEENIGTTVGIANPASVNCEKNGGRLEIVEGTGGQIGMCTLSDGVVCEERAYMRGECGAPTPDTGNEGICTMEYMPVCARVEVQCIKAPCPSIEQTFGNTCMMNANKLAVFLHDGECAK